jgi:hypothetical protein
MTICFRVRDPRVVVDPDRYAGARQRIDPAVAATGGGLVGDQLDLDAAVVRAQQCLDDPRPGRQAVGADQDLVLGPIDGVHGKRRTVAFRCKTSIDRGRWRGRLSWCGVQDGRRDEQASAKQAKQPAARPDSVGEDFAPMSSGPVPGHPSADFVSLFCLILLIGVRRVKTDRIPERRPRGDCVRHVACLGGSCQFMVSFLRMRKER